MESARPGHRPALDGLRGVGVLMVMWGHASYRPLHELHTFGVEVFFVLSGFLIGEGLLREVACGGHVDLPAFYRRRARRLLPALVTFLAGVLLLAVLGAWPVRTALMGGTYALSYTVNLAALRRVDLGPVAHLWSLSLEEQFYLCLPVLAALACRLPVPRRVPALWVVVGLGIAASTWARLVQDGERRSYFAPDTRLGSLLVGVALALLLAGRPGALGLPVRRAGQLAAVLVLAAASTGRAHEDVRFFAASVAAAVLVATAHAGDGPVARVLRSAPLRWAGELSYGLYLWHYAIYRLFGPISELPTWSIVPAVGCSVVLAVTSMVFVEARFLSRRPTVLGARWVRRLASVRPGQRQPAPA